MSVSEVDKLCLVPAVGGRGMRLTSRGVVYVLQNQAKGLSRWMTEMEAFLKAEHAALGDLHTIDGQLTESDVSWLYRECCESIT